MSKKHNLLRAYRRNQVQEYIVWVVYENKLNWYRLLDGEYISLESDAAGCAVRFFRGCGWLYQHY
ncbi:MAG: hypothetical protein RML39_10425 [Oscillatoriaceae cyanobacterium SKYGB_i_bin93]|nr:hypothetical protein [Oscillatoriaceae cyanobacterium SKYGB_i_bin93]